MTYRVTHVDHKARRHQLVLVCEARATAAAIAEAMYGAARYLAIIRIGGRP